MDPYIAPSNRGRCADCGKLVHKSRTSASVQRCLDCRRANPAPRANGRPGLKSSRECRDCGRTFIRENGHLCNTCTSARHRAKHGRKYKRKACDWCGMVHPLRENGTTLDPEGLTHAQWIRFYGKPSRSTELAIVPRPVARWSSRFDNPVPVRPWWSVIVQGPCAQCGDSFAALSTTGQALYCSKRCAARAGKGTPRRPLGRFVVSARRRRRLYERDKWICQICGDPTAREWRLGDPWAPTLDHIEPQSYTLIPDHSDGALRTAHAICNTLRGAAIRTDAEVRAAIAERRFADVAV